jgi:hypothetical protein
MKLLRVHLIFHPGMMNARGRLADAGARPGPVLRL